MRSNKGLVFLVFILLVIIGVMAWFLFSTPVPDASNQVATTTPTKVTPKPTPTPTTPPPPLSASVKVTSPASGAKVGKSFTVTGSAPNAWYFEAVFPIQVRDTNGNVIAQGQGQAQSDWTTPGPVAFKSTLVIQGGYNGPATLILLKDNESGMPENDDSTSIPIVIQ